MRMPLELLSGRRIRTESIDEPGSAAEALRKPRTVVAVASGDEVERERWARALEAAGHGVIEASTTLALLDLAKVHQPDLVVCSVDAAGVDGFEVLKGIRAESRTALVPCLLTSADPGDWRRSMAKGADDFLAAPVATEELVEAVMARLDRLRTINELAARTSSQRFPSELLELVVRKAPVAEILQRVAQQLEQSIGAIAVLPRICQGDQLETIHATGFGPRSWARLDRLIGRLLEESTPSTNPARKEMVLPLSSSLLLFFATQKINQKPGRLWHVPIRGEEGALLGCFEIFLGLGRESERWMNGANRAALDPMFRLAAVLMERQQVVDELTRQTHFDSITGLPNRKEFERHLQEACRRGEESGAAFAIVCIDIDRFQRVNDNYGYDAADRLLVEFAARLRQQSRCQDLPARISGDEFALFVSESPDRKQLQRLTERLVENLSQPYLIDHHRIVVSVTAGIAIYPTDALRPSEMLVRAEAALGAARNSLHSQVALFQHKEPEQLVDGVDMESYLERALVVNGFVLHYQPVYRNRGGCVGYEALIRLKRGLLDEIPSDRRELIAPGVFLPAAEKSGMILPIGAWAFDEACRQAREWLNSGFHCPRIAVNLSARQLTQTCLVETFAASLRKHSILPSMIDLELTETAVINDHQSGKRCLDELKQLGFRIAIDDFGIGYSSLSYLNSFPADVIKIDQSFVQRLGTQREELPKSALRRSDPSLPVIGAILALANNLEADVVAEGVETPEQYRILSGAGCHEFQGFLFARPMSAAALRNFIESHRGWTSDHFATFTV